MKKPLSKKLHLHRESLRQLEAALGPVTDNTQVLTGACCHTRLPGCNPDDTQVITTCQG